MAENEGPQTHSGYVQHALKRGRKCICERCIEYRIDVQRGRDPRALARVPRTDDARDAQLDSQLTALGAMARAMRRVFP